MPSLTIENYVQGIYQICLDDPAKAASTGEIAGVMGVSPGTVTSMLKTLSDSGLASYTRYEGVHLTAEGRLLALRILRRHRLVALFLGQTLEMTWEEVDAEAEHLEHAVSDVLIDRIDQFLGFPATDPHGDPIPTADGQIRGEAGVRLTQWPPGKSFRLLRVTDKNPSFLRYLAENSLQPDCQGKLISARPEAGIVMIEVNGQPTALGLEAAEKLMVAGV